jgi:hypothetical protein
VEKGKDKVIALLKADGTDWTVIVDYADKPAQRCRVVGKKEK